MARGPSGLIHFILLAPSFLPLSKAGGAVC